MPFVRSAKQLESGPLISWDVLTDWFTSLPCLVSDFFGMPNAPLQSMIEAIQTMTHLIRTAFGDSMDGYSSNPSCSPHTGLLQGNAAAMAGNSVAISVFVKMMKSTGFGLNIWSALTYEAIKLVCSNFVDDTQLFHGGPNNYTLGWDVYRQMQPMLDYLEAALRATGGALAHEKVIGL
jgi:hypothetical protein